MLNQPLVSVICLCYNHEKYIERAVESVLYQSYRNIELIIVDDASTDGSQAMAKKLGEKHNLRTILLPENQGNCRAFNTGFAMSKGQFLIDLAADDVLLPERIELGVKALQDKDPAYGVNFCDIELISENGKSLGTHFQRDVEGKLIQTVADGDMYALLLEKYYISTPTMLMRREVLEKLGGYDENLSYEDFDFWIRSARDYKYCYTDQVLMQKRVISDSHSAKQYERKNPHCYSTAIVCQKALELNKTPEENLALGKRVNYELKWALITENWEAAKVFINVKRQIPHVWIRRTAESIILKIEPSWYWFWKIFI
jgi:glycosyltransferase involved in cell wall biosynthesis